MGSSFLTVFALFQASCRNYVVVGTVCGTETGKLGFELEEPVQTKIIITRLLHI